MGVGVGLYMYDVVVKKVHVRCLHLLVSSCHFVVPLSLVVGRRQDHFRRAFFELVTVETFSYMLRR